MYGTVTGILEKLLGQSTKETDDGMRQDFARCLGEVGAICEQKIGNVVVGSSTTDDRYESTLGAFKWRLGQPPWQAPAFKYELYMVTTLLVSALQAAPTSTDQHKIAFTVQQLLHKLNHACQQQGDNLLGTGKTEKSKTMSTWLKDKLQDSKVFDTLEPYFHSEFKEKVSRCFGISLL